MAKRSAVRKYTKRKTRSVSVSRSTSPSRSTSRSSSKATRAIVGTRKRGSGRRVTQAEATRRANESAARSAQTARLRAAATKTKQAKDAAQVKHLRRLKRSTAFKTRYGIATPRAGRAPTPGRSPAAPAVTGEPPAEAGMGAMEEEDYIEIPGEGEVQVQCSRGYKYTPIGREKCAAGYHGIWEGWFPSRRYYCVCDYTPPAALSENGEGEGFFEGIFGGDAGGLLPDTGKMGGMALLVVGGAIIVALLGMFKK